MAGVITQIPLRQLVDEIKREGKLSGSADMDQIVLDIINELLLSYSLNNRYFELLQLNTSIITTDAIGNYPLPADFQHVQLVRYLDSLNNRRTLYKRNEFVANPSGTIPRYNQLAGQIINIMPYDDVKAGESILLDYYALPPKMTDLDNDYFPIPKLYPSLKTRAVYRALVYNKVDTANQFKTEASETELRSKPSG